VSRLEFGITPMRGYRKWDVRDGRLVSHYNQVWPLRAPAQAVCTRCSRAGLPIPSGTKHGHFAGEGCGLYAWSAPELVERHCTLLSKRIQCWGVVEGWGRVVEHEKGFRVLCMRPLALSPLFPIDLKLLEDMAAAYEIRLLMSAGEVRRAFPPLTTGALSSPSTYPAASS
jgi:hypothetical protein